MTNEEIILKEAVAHHLYTEEEATAILMTGGSLNLHTFAGWKERGYMVKRGEHAKITTTLWKYVTKKKQKENGDEQETSKMYLAKAFLFTIDQVEKMN